ncbi:hypothetical protein BKA59DRAFT_390807, partial [Fusarium tricinctum]
PLFIIFKRRILLRAVSFSILYLDFFSTISKSIFTSKLSNSSKIGLIIISITFPKSLLSLSLNVLILINKLLRNTRL